MTEQTLLAHQREAFEGEPTVDLARSVANHYYLLYIEELREQQAATKMANALFVELQAEQARNRRFRNRIWVVVGILLTIAIFAGEQWLMRIWG